MNPSFIYKIASCNHLYQLFCWYVGIHWMPTSANLARKIFGVLGTNTLGVNPSFWIRPCLESRERERDQHRDRLGQAVGLQDRRQGMEYYSKGVLLP